MGRKVALPRSHHERAHDMKTHTSPIINTDAGSETHCSPAIELHGLSKTYRPQPGAPVHALVHVTLSVPAGQVAGILGPNASGKTTLVKLIAGMVRPTAGHVRVLGLDMVRERAIALRRIGVALGAGPQRHSQPSVWDYLLQCGQGMDVGGLDVTARAMQLLQDFDLWERREDPLHTCSSTMQRKVALARVLLADAPIVVFDEPALELDARSTHTIRRWITQLARERGKTV